MLDPMTFKPTPDNVVERMLDLAKLKKGEIFYDLGSGDGRIVIAAAKRGAVAYGVELNHELVMKSMARIEKEKLKRAYIIEGDFLKKDYRTSFHLADVVTLYISQEVHQKLKKKLLKLREGSRIVCHDFVIDTLEGTLRSAKRMKLDVFSSRYWDPEKIEEVGEHRLYLYRI